MSAEAQKGLFLDTGVLTQAFDLSHTKRAETARELLVEATDTDRLCLSTQVLQELFVIMTERAQIPWAPEQALSVLDVLSAWPVLTVDQSMVREAVLLARVASLDLWNALTVVAAAHSGAEILYTEDLPHGRKLLGVEIESPF